MDTAGITRLSPGTEPEIERREARSGHRVGAIDRWLAAQVQRRIESGPVRLELWDGSSPYQREHPPVGDLIVEDRVALLGLAWYPDLYFGEHYMSGRVRIRGDLYPIVEALSRSSASRLTRLERVQAALGRSNTPDVSRRNVHHHYDLGNDFYSRWLDPEMVYTCAYYASAGISLLEAQIAKFDHVCRKLRLSPGETVVEAGCGWGSLALHMARRYGVRVRAFNISREQLAFARDRAAREGLADRVAFIDDDYRNVTGTFDAFVSVGMLEHVGTAHFPTLASVLQRTLKRAGGRGLLHFIGRDTPRPLNAWIRRRIFPGAYPPTLAEVATRVLAPAEMSVLDIENLRLHYARTLADWRSNFNAAAEHVRAVNGPEFYRAWDLYLAGSQAAFATGWLQLFQVVFAPRESAPPSWTRGDPFHPAGAAG